MLSPLIFPCLLLLATQYGLLSGYSQGGPRSQCGSMKPGHGLDPQTSNSPFEVKLSSNKISSGSSVNVELKPKTSEDFEGFFVQARDSQDNVVGTFVTLGDEGKYVACDSKVQSAVTHTKSNFKTLVKVKWNAPSDFQGKVRILATFVTDYSNYWVKVPSRDLEVVKKLAANMTQNGFVVPTTTPEPENETEVLVTSENLGWSNFNILGWSSETPTQPKEE